LSEKEERKKRKTFLKNNKNRVSLNPLLQHAFFNAVRERESRFIYREKRKRKKTKKEKKKRKEKFRRRLIQILAALAPLSESVLVRGASREVSRSVFVTGWREKKETKKKKFGYFVIKSC
jgi:hypothetical protein